MSQLNKKPIRVVIVDDHSIFREGLRLLIEAYGSGGPRNFESGSQFEVVGEAGNRTDALRTVACEQPDVVLLNLTLQGENGLGLLPELLSAAKGAKVLVLTGIGGAEEHYRAVRLGAMGIVTKGQAPEMLLCAIESVCAGEVWLEQAVTARILSELLVDTGTETQDPEADRIARLTTRERGIIALVGDGLKNKQIADRLNISEVTVRHHLTSVFSKLKVSDRLGLALYAYQYGLAKPPFEAYGRSGKGAKSNILLQVNN